MQYDVFISYSRKDTALVNSLIERLRREIPGIKVWFDIEGVESADAFKRKIIKAIEDSNVVLFACSDNSLESEYCEKEVTYAKNLGKKVLPYLLPESQLKGWLLFDYGNINCIHSSKEEEVTRMINDLRRWTQNTDNTENTQNDNNNDSIISNPSGLECANTVASELEFDPISGEFRKRNNKVQENGVGFINGHEYVDLGLPSGLKWATCNVGASKPEEYGDYFAWGEMNTKSYFSDDNSETDGKSDYWLRSNDYIGDNGDLTLSHDAAYQNWGGSWRMPTKKELNELLDNTVPEWTTRNGVNGCLVKSKKNGNSIFLPAASCRTKSSHDDAGLCGRCWSSTPKDSSSYFAYYLFFASDKFFSVYDCRSHGLSVRPVSE